MRARVRSEAGRAQDAGDGRGGPRGPAQPGAQRDDGERPGTGDGAGILTQIPDGFFRRECEELGIELPEAGHYGVGMLFESGEVEELDCGGRLAEICAEEGQDLLGFRDVPIVPEAVGKVARGIMPRIRQFFIGRRGGDEAAFERKLYVIRRLLHKAVEDSHGCYVVSLSSKTIIYKGLLKGQQLPRFYPDLRDAAFASAIALVHERFSTNTLGSWELAHPYRYIAHNGEVNTIRGNINWMRARENRLRSSSSGRTWRSSPRLSCPARATRPPSTMPSSYCTLPGGACRTRWP